MAGGVAGVAGQGQTYQVKFNNAFSLTDAYQFDIVNVSQVLSVGTGDLFLNSLSGNTFNIWQGQWFGQSPLFLGEASYVLTFGLLFGVPFAPYAMPLLTMNTKLYTGDGNGFAFSAINDPTLWNSRSDTGSGQVNVQNQESTQEIVQGLNIYQGQLAVFMRHSIQIWQVNADPAQYNRVQTLENTGTIAPLSAQGIGELDVIYLSDTGFRSLRVRDSSLNAVVTDVGSSVDSLVTDDLNALSIQNWPISLAIASCAVVEPQSNRYWCYLNGKIYVLSYFPASKIIAWSIYTCTYTDSFGNVLTFVPQKFLIFKGQVYVLAKSSNTDEVVLQYGGTNNNTFDKTQCIVETPWLDCKKPGHAKVARGMDVALTGTWDFAFGVDYVDESLTKVVGSLTHSSFDFGSIKVTGNGNFFKIRATSKADTNAATLSSLIYYFEEGKEG